MFRACNSCGAFDIDDNHACGGKRTDDQAQKPSPPRSFNLGRKVETRELPKEGMSQGEIEKELEKMKPDATPREWWIDDVTQIVCAPWNHPTLGIAKMPWPDSEKVIHVIEKSAYEQIRKQRDESIENYNRKAKMYVDTLLELQKAQNTIRSIRCAPETMRLLQERDALSEKFIFQQEECDRISIAHNETKKERDALLAKHEELLSYLPKVPTEPYEKRLAKECDALKARIAELERGRYDVMQEKRLESELAAAKAEVERLNDIHCDFQGSAEQLTQANARIADLEAEICELEVAFVPYQKFKDLEDENQKLAEIQLAVVANLKEREQKLVAALSGCHDELVEHYNRAKCYHCKLVIDEASEALKANKGEV